MSDGLTLCTQRRFDTLQREAKTSKERALVRRTYRARNAAETKAYKALQDTLNAQWEEQRAAYKAYIAANPETMEPDQSIKEVGRGMCPTVNTTPT